MIPKDIIEQCRDSECEGWFLVAPKKVLLKKKAADSEYAEFLYPGFSSTMESLSGRWLKCRLEKRGHGLAFWSIGVLENGGTKGGWDVKWNWIPDWFADYSLRFAPKLEDGDFCEIRRDLTKGEIKDFFGSSTKDFLRDYEELKKLPSLVVKKRTYRNSRGGWWYYIKDPDDGKEYVVPEAFLKVSASPGSRGSGMGGRMHSTGTAKSGREKTDKTVGSTTGKDDVGKTGAQKTGGKMGGSRKGKTGGRRSDKGKSEDEKSGGSKTSSKSKSGKGGKGSARGGKKSGEPENRGGKKDNVGIPVDVFKKFLEEGKPGWVKVTDWEKIEEWGVQRGSSYPRMEGWNPGLNGFMRVVEKRWIRVYLKPGASTNIFLRSDAVLSEGRAVSGEEYTWSWIPEWFEDYSFRCCPKFKVGDKVIVRMPSDVEIEMFFPPKSPVPKWIEKMSGEEVIIENMEYSEDGGGWWYTVDGDLIPEALLMQPSSGGGKPGGGKKTSSKSAGSARSKRGASQQKQKPGRVPQEIIEKFLEEDDYGWFRVAKKEVLKEWKKTHPESVSDYPDISDGYTLTDGMMDLEGMWVKVRKDKHISNRYILKTVGTLKDGKIEGWTPIWGWYPDWFDDYSLKCCPKFSRGDWVMVREPSFFEATSFYNSLIRTDALENIAKVTGKKVRVNDKVYYDDEGGWWYGVEGCMSLMPEVLLEPADKGEPSGGKTKKRSTGRRKKTTGKKATSSSNLRSFLVGETLVFQTTITEGIEDKLRGLPDFHYHIEVISADDGKTGRFGIYEGPDRIITGSWSVVGGMTTIMATISDPDISIPVLEMLKDNLEKVFPE